MKIRMTFLALALAACAGIDTPAPVEDVAAEVSCATVERVQSIALAGVPGALQYADLTGRAAARFMQAYNDEPPASDEKADRIVALISPSAPVVFVMFSTNGCVTNAGPLPLDLFERLAKGPRSA